MLDRKKLCRKYMILGKEMQERQHYFKEFAYATTERSTFVFGKVATHTSPCTTPETETQSRRARLSAA
jgi:hypothetical protein